MMNFWYIFGLVVCLIVLFFAWALCRISAMSDIHSAGIYDQWIADSQNGEEEYKHEED